MFLYKIFLTSDHFYDINIFNSTTTAPAVRRVLQAVTTSPTTATEPPAVSPGTSADPAGAPVATTSPTTTGTLTILIN